MAFVDEIILKAKAGKGGDGVVRWLHLKGKEFSGPAGGNGGKGGDVIFRGVRDVNILARYRGRDVFKAENGEHGKSKNMTGKGGAHQYIDVPVGSFIRRKQTGTTFEFLKENEEVTVLRGGRGGYGNAHFTSSTNQYPTEWTGGEEGEADAFFIELRLIADAGLIGLPNAGKSSLLNALTKAKSKIAPYAFTTLEPNLGVYHNFILADIPGLIEGASHGKGLGYAFLRHIARTRILIHCVASDVEDPIAAYKTVRQELEKHDPELSRKAEMVVLTKSDSVSGEATQALIESFRSVGITAIPSSIHDPALIKRVGDSLTDFLRSH